MKKRNRLFSLLLTLAMVVTFMPATAFAEVRNEGEGDWGKICFDGDDDYEWAHFYNVDVKHESQAALDMEDLNITVMDGDGVIDSDGYDISIERVYYDEEEEREIGVPVDPPFGIWEGDKGEGFTSYRAIATPKEGSEYEDEGWLEGQFVVMDKHSLAFYCATIEFTDSTWHDRWRMHDRYWFNQNTDITCKVKHFGDENYLTENTHYKVTYYRVARPEDMDDDNVPYEEIMVVDPEYLVTDDKGKPVKPSKPGSYFARIEGIDPYYGANNVLVEIDDDSHIILRSMDHDLWSDDTLTYKVQIPVGVEGDPEFYGGIISNWEASPMEWKICFTGKDFFTYDKAKGELTLNGANIFHQYQESHINDGHLDIWARISTTEEGEYKLLAEGFADADVREARYEYDLPEDEDMLPCWEGWIDDSFHARIQNSDYPDGEDFDLDITDVKIIDDGEDPEDDPTVLKLKKEDNGWSYHPKKSGTATILLTYEDYDETEKEHKYTVTVSDTVYRADCWSTEGIYQGLPGTSIDLQASAVKCFVVKKGDDPDEWDDDETNVGLNFRWAIEEGAEFATITPDSKDASKATLTFKNVDQDDLHERIKVKVEVTDDYSGDPEEGRAQRSQDYWLSNEFYQILPAAIDSDLNMGDSLDLEPQVWMYRSGEQPVQIRNADFEINDYDDNAIDVEEKDGKFTIFRKGEWENNFSIEASWDSEHGEGWTDQWYHLNRKDYWSDYAEAKKELEKAKEELEKAKEELEKARKDHEKEIADRKAAEEALIKAERDKKAAEKALADAKAALKATTQAVGATHREASCVYTVTSSAKKTVEFTKAANKKNTTVPNTVVIGGDKFTVTAIAPYAFTGEKNRTVTIKAAKLTKKSVKKSLAGSKVKKITVKVSGNKKTNKKYVKNYKKYFSEKNAGKKVSVK